MTGAVVEIAKPIQTADFKTLSTCIRGTVSNDFPRQAIGAGGGDHGTPAPLIGADLAAPPFHFVEGHVGDVGALVSFGGIGIVGFV